MAMYVIRYEHDPSSYAPIHMAVVASGSTPAPEDWTPAYRDTMGGQRVVWIRSDVVEGDAWVQDHMGMRKAKLYR